MIINHLPVYCDKDYKPSRDYKYNILDIMNLSVKVTDNRYNIPLEMLFSMAARINKKRRFLFVSRVLGKHIPVKNANSLLTGALLAYKFLEDFHKKGLPVAMEIADSLRESRNGNDVWKKIISNPVPLEENVLFVAFAETATALGHSVFSCFANARFIHTTRDIIPDFKNMIKFEEEHSHATSHRVYALDSGIFSNDGPVVFIDDEISTGKTVLNIIKEINRTYPGKEYVVLSIMDLRSKEDRDYLERFEKEEGIRVDFISLISGEFETELGSKFKSWDEADTWLEKVRNARQKNSKVHESMDIEVKYLGLDKYFEDFVMMSSVNGKGEVNSTPYLKATGRFGMDYNENIKLHRQLKKASEYIAGEISGERILFLGTEEFMYIPMCISGLIEKDIYYHSTTRSPIYADEAPEYPVKSVFRFDCPSNPSVTNYVYNIPYGYYHELYLFFERGFYKHDLKEMLDVIHTWGIKKINILTCSGEIRDM